MDEEANVEKESEKKKILDFNSNIQMFWPTKVIKNITSKLVLIPPSFHMILALIQFGFRMRIEEENIEKMSEIESKIVSIIGWRCKCRQKIIWKGSEKNTYYI